MIFEIISGGKKLTGWGKNGPAYFFPGERMGRPILSPGKKLTGGKFRPVTPGINHNLGDPATAPRGQLRRYRITAATSEVILRENIMGPPGFEPRTPA